MRSILANLTSLISASFFVTMSNAAITTMIGILVAKSGGGQSDVALIAACYSVGFLAGCILAPSHIQRVGFIRAFTAAAAVLTIAIIALDMAGAVLVWAGLRLMMGFAVAVTTAIADAWINGTAPNDQRGRIIAVYSIVLGIASIASQMAFLFLDAGTDGFVLLFAIAMNSAVVLVAMTSSAVPEVPAVRPGSISAFRDISPAASIGAFASGFARAGIISIVPFYLAKNGVEENLVAMAVAALYLGRLVFQWPIGQISDRLDRRSVLAALAIGTAIIMFLTVLPSSYEGRFISGEAGRVNQTVSFLVLLVLGGVLFPMYSVASSIAFDRAGGRSMVDISTSLLIAYSVGSIAGPFTIMLTSRIFGDSALHICILMACALTLFIALFKRATTEQSSQITPSAATFVPDTSLEMAHVAGEQAEERLEDTSRPA
jgi:MFS family permease